MTDLEVLWKLGFYNRQVYVLDTNARQLSLPTGEQISWPGLWVLAKHHMKHVWNFAKKPCPEMFTKIS